MALSHILSALVRSKTPAKTSSSLAFGFLSACHALQVDSQFSFLLTSLHGKFDFDQRVTSSEITLTHFLLSFSCSARYLYLPTIMASVGMHAYSYKALLIIFKPFFGEAALFEMDEILAPYHSTFVNFFFTAFIRHHEICKLIEIIAQMNK